MQPNAPGKIRLTIASVALVLGSLAFANAEQSNDRSVADDRGVLAGPRVDPQSRNSGRHFDGQRMGRRHGGGDKARRHPDRVLFHTVEQLDLNEQQEAEIKEIREKAMQQFKSWREENGPNLKNFREQMHQAEGSGDQDKMRQLAEQRREMMKTGPNPRLIADQITSVLTEPQKAEFEQKMHDAHRRMDSSRGGDRDMRRGDRDRPRHDRMRQGPGREGRLIEQLDLSNEQRRQIEQIHKDAMARVKALLTESQKAELERRVQQMRDRSPGKRRRGRGADGRRPRSKGDARPDRPRNSRDSRPPRNPGTPAPSNDTKLDL